MSGTSGSVLFLLRRCVAARRLPLLTAAVRSRIGVPSVRWSSTQRRTWTSETPTDHLTTAWQLQPVSRCIQHGFCTKAGPHCEEEYPPLPAYEPESGPGTKEVYIVQVKGLPWTCTKQDLLNFFSDCRIRDGEKGVYLTLDHLGKPSGQALLELEHKEDVMKALDKHQQYHGSLYVQVTEVTNSKVEEILKSSVLGGQDGVVQLRGMPYSCSEDDIRHFFSGLDIKEDGITIFTDSKGRNSGRAYVEFSSQKEADKALQRNRQLIGHRYIKVLPSSRSSIQSSVRDRLSHLTPPQDTGRRAGSDPQTEFRPASAAPQSLDAPVHYVHMRGLPRHVSVEEIVQFFAPLVVSKIVVNCGSTGWVQGEAEVYFSNHRDAVSAMSKDRKYIGHRYMELFLNSE